MSIIRKWSAPLLAIILLAVILVTIQQTGRGKVSVPGWHALLGLQDEFPLDYVIHYAYPIAIDRSGAGPITLESFGFGAYSDVEIVGVHFFRGLSTDIPLRGQIPHRVIESTQTSSGKQVNTKHERHQGLDSVVA